MTGYDFSALSDSDFERLVCDVWNVAFGLKLRTYPQGRDGGIDLREIGSDGFVTVGQCKHYGRTGKAKFLQAVHGETKKSGYRHANRYLFATTYPMTASVELEVAEILGVPVGDIWGPEAINDFLRSPVGREVVNVHFKLWLSSAVELERIVRAGAWNRASAVLNQIGNDAKCWVEVPAFAEAMDILHSQGVCLITGLPGVGKSFLAQRLVLESVFQGWQFFPVLDSPEEIWDLWESPEKRIFYFDDFLGEGRLKKSAVDYAADLLAVISNFRENSYRRRLIMTSRESVIREAMRSSSDRLERIVTDPARCTVMMGELEDETKMEILATHLFFSGIADGERESARMDRRMMSISRHAGFNPRIISTVTQDLSADSTRNDFFEALQECLVRPEIVWRKSFDNLDMFAQDILLTLACLPPRPIESKALRSISEVGGSIREWKRNLRLLEGTWIRVTESDHACVIAFLNPSCRDYLLDLLNDSDYADEWVGRIQRVDQLLNLTHEAGLIAVDRTGRSYAERPRLARVLAAERAYFASRIENWTTAQLGERVHPTARLRLWADAALLLTVYGREVANDWLLDRVAQLRAASDSDLPTHPALILAVRLQDVPGLTPCRLVEVIEGLVETALRNARTARDMLSYEDLPENIRSESIQAVARDRAQLIFEEEVEMLVLHGDNPRVIVEEGLELQGRAKWYGFELDLGDLYDQLETGA